MILKKEDLKPVYEALDVLAAMPPLEIPEMSQKHFLGVKANYREIAVSDSNQRDFLYFVSDRHQYFDTKGKITRIVALAAEVYNHEHVLSMKPKTE